MRRLPIYFLLDTKFGSESLNDLTYVLSTWISILRQNPQAIETAYISINSLSQNNYKINDLISIENVGSIQLIHTDSCCLGKNLSLLSETLQREILNNKNIYRDYKPMVFILLFNEPDDDLKKHLTLYRKLKHTTVAVLFGNQIKIECIKNLTENICDANTMDSQSFMKFFMWGDESIFPYSEKTVYSDNVINLKK